ncbi:MAG: hypothetical protein IIB10_05980 [Chloroflexi bacterium]|nr:hypothetical protein [Chloroflexota bacterium]MCI0891053.1 hypothetical protein [Chloroflexota bacterium]
MPRASASELTELQDHRVRVVAVEGATVAADGHHRVRHKFPGFPEQSPLVI